MKKTNLKGIIKEILLEGGYSNRYPGGKTPGLSTDVLNKILLRIAQGKGTEEEPYQGDPDKGNKILDTADQENVDRITRGEDPVYDRMQELAGIKTEITINKPNNLLKYKQGAIDNFLELKEKDRDETYNNNEFYDGLIYDIKNSSSIEEINNIVFKDFFFGDDTEGMEYFKKSMKEKTK